MAEPRAGAAPLRRRFKSGDVALHLDMAVIGEVCLGVSLSGFRSVVAAFLTNDSGSLGVLLDALDAQRCTELRAAAHAVKGAAASMGLRAVDILARDIESHGGSFSAQQCRDAAALLRERVDTTLALCRRMGFV